MNTKLAIVLSTLPLVATAALATISARAPQREQERNPSPIPAETPQDPAIAAVKAAQYGQIELSLVDRNGECIKETEFELVRLDGGWTAPWPHDVVLVEDRFVFSNLRPGRYKLEASDRWTTANPRESLAGYADVSAGAATSLTLSLAPTQSCSASGRVMHGDEGVADAEISATLHVWPQPLHAQTRTASNGSFSFALPRPGRWRFHIRLAEWNAFREWNCALGDEFVREISAPEASSLRMILPEGRLAGMVRELDGTPAAHELVVLNPESPWIGKSSVHTDANGRYEFRNLAIGSYRVRAGPQRGVLRRKGALVCRSAKLTERSQRLEDFDLQLVAGGSLEVELEFPDGVVSRTLHVSVRPSSAPSGAWYFLGSTDEDGRLGTRAIPYVVPSGPIAISAQSPLLNLATPAGARAIVEASEHTELRVALVPATIVTIRAQDERGTPRFVRVVDLQTADGERMDSAQPDGHFAPLVRTNPIPPGEYVLRIADPAGRTYEQTIQLDGEPERDVLFQL